MDRNGAPIPNCVDFVDGTKIFMEILGGLNDNKKVIQWKQIGSLFLVLEYRYYAVPM